MAEVHAQMDALIFFHADKKRENDMTPVQLREARALLGLTQEQLADMTDLSLSTIEDMESGRPVNESLVDAIHVALEAAGIEIVVGADSEPPVRLR